MATGRSGSKRTRGKKSAPARKRARKVKPKARAKAGKPKARSRPRKPAKKARIRPRATRPASKRVRSAPSLAKAVAMRGAAPAMAAGDDMAAKVEHELQVQGYHQPDPTVVATLAALCRGVADESSGPPDWLNLDGD